MPDDRAPTLDYHSPDDPPPTNEALRAALGCALTCILLFFLAALIMFGSAAAAWVGSFSFPYGRYVIITGTVFCLLLCLGLYLFFRQNSWGFLKGVLIGRLIILVLEGLCYFRLFR
ncbi:MAG TPA: hypothetical protein VGQ99_10800 [Tepidisphaeraceae bacterium]|jgi:hypothetical protein|nr:hypothetical protein [Tepidisphaeraceae bacterium]